MVLTNSANSPICTMDGTMMAVVLMMTVGVYYVFSQQCAQNVANTVYFRSNDFKLFRFNLDKDKNKWNETEVCQNVREFKIEDDEITLMSFKGLLKRVKLATPEKAEKEIQLTNTPKTHWTTFCRLGKYTCVAGHDSKAKQTAVVLIQDHSSQLPVNVTYANDSCSVMLILLKTTTTTFRT